MKVKAVHKQILSSLLYKGSPKANTLILAVFLAQNHYALELPLKILSSFTTYSVLNFLISLPAEFGSDGSNLLNLKLVTAAIDSENNGRWKGQGVQNTCS